MKTGLNLQPNRSRLAFTMVEIALCLAIVGFALVAIIGVLPTGMNVQRDNRLETIINQDAAVWLDTIRNGSEGYDNLTNFVLAITNYWTRYEITENSSGVRSTNLASVPFRGTNGYTTTSSSVMFPSLPSNAFPLTNGANIVGILSTPKYSPTTSPVRPGIFTSNYVVAYVRAFSGAAVEKTPQSDPDILASAFAYRMVVENTAYVPVDKVNWAVTNGMTAEQLAVEIPRLREKEILQDNQQANSRDLRLLFRWPLLPKGIIGNGRQTFRALVGGKILETNHLVETGHPLFFFQPASYEVAP